MIKVIVLKALQREIEKTFKKDSLKIYALIRELKTNPNKGKLIAHINNTHIRELKYKSYRFYFTLDGYKLYLFNKDQITELLIRFMRMSKKHNQQQTINKIKGILKSFGEEGFEEEGD